MQQHEDLQKTAGCLQVLGTCVSPEELQVNFGIGVCLCVSSVLRYPVLGQCCRRLPGPMAVPLAPADAPSRGWDPPRSDPRIWVWGALF